MSILIEEWMIGEKLGLKGCELLVFAALDVGSPDEFKGGNRL